MIALSMVAMYQIEKPLFKTFENYHGIKIKQMDKKPLKLLLDQSLIKLFLPSSKDSFAIDGENTY